MPKPSILQNIKECYVCGATVNLHCHHIYMGANRKVSEDNGFKVWLCGHHHNLSNDGVHGKHGHELDMYLKETCQKEFEKTHTREEFMQLVGRNYL